MITATPISDRNVRRLQGRQEPVRAQRDAFWEDLGKTLMIPTSFASTSRRP